MSPRRYANGILGVVGLLPGSKGIYGYIPLSENLSGEYEFFFGLPRGQREKPHTLFSIPLLHEIMTVGAA